MTLPVRSILVIEDDPLVSMMLEEMIEDLGHVVIASPNSRDEAISAIRELDYDMAIIDFNLWGKKSCDLVVMLREHSIPFVVSSGYSRDDLPPELADAILITKPFLQDELEAAIDRILPTPQNQP